MNEQKKDLGREAAGLRNDSSVEASSLKPQVSSLVLEACGLSKSYGGRLVVKGVNIAVKEGEVVGLLGRNGAGKTTTFRMIVGLVRALSGRVFYRGEDVSGLPMYQRARRGIGYLPQEPSVFRDMTAEDNLLVAAEATGAPREKVVEALEEFGLGAVRRSKAAVLSGGERRRLEVARVLLTSPKVLLFDEPFAGIDPVTVNDLQEVMFGLRKRGIAILLTDHNVRETLAVTERAYIMEEGSIWLEGTPEDLAESEEARRLYLGKNFSLDPVLRERVRKASDG